MASWSTSANSNILANTGINVDENCAPSVLNDSIREIMAVLKTAITTGAVTTTGLIDASGAAAGQIKFPATQNASADLNTLDDYQENTFTGTLTGGTTAPTVTIRYTKIGKVVFLTSAGSLAATSDSTAKTITGMPAELYPSANSRTMVSVSDNGGSFVPGLAQIDTGGVITVYPNLSGSNWTASGTATIDFFSLSYVI